MTRGIAEIHADLIATRDAIEAIALRRRAAATTPEDLVWAALTIAKDPATCTSILNSAPVQAGHLDATRLYHAQRGAPPPSSDTYILVTKPMLHAIIEAGPLPEPPDETPLPDNVVAIGTQPPRILPPRTRIPR